MRGFNQLGHDAIFVWSPTFEEHTADLQRHIARGCTVRSARACYQAPPGGGAFFSVLDAPLDACGLCGGTCKVRSVRIGRGFRSRRR